ncbi:MAG: hypothetical protein PHV59_03220 [Victivallales bacterium]|nr:hypothetical protein [Victivallales bacterium]
MEKQQALPSNYDYSQCFGIKEFCEKLDPECYLCEFMDACHYAAHATDPDRCLGMVSYERYNYSGEVAETLEATTEPDKEVLEFTRRDLMDVLAFLLRMDEYALNLAAAVLQGQAMTTADLGRFMGVSRQAVHRKLKDACDQCPELRELFVGNLYRCKRITRHEKTWTQPQLKKGIGKHSNRVNRKN